MDYKQIIDNFEKYMLTNTKLMSRSSNLYKRIIKNFLLYVTKKNRSLSFNIDDVNQFINIKTTGSKRGFNTKYALKCFLISIGKNDWIYKLKPLKNKPRKKEFPYFDRIVMHKIIKGLKNPYNGIALIQSKTGARFTEAATIKIQDIFFNLHEKFIYIQIGEYAKGMKKRRLIMNKKYEAHLRRLMGNNRFGFLFLDNKYDSMNQEVISKKCELMLKYYNRDLNKIGEMQNIVGLSSHYIRHHYADTFLLQPGANIDKLKFLLGHSKIDTTKDYVSKDIQDKYVEHYLERDDVDI